MAEHATMARPARLSRDRIVATALELVDAEGAGGLTMRALAARLGVDPMAVYRHVRDKQDLLGAMCDAAIAELPDLDPQLPWKPQLRTLVVELRDLLVRRPALLPVLAAAPATPASLAVAQRAVAVLVRAGIAEATAATAFGVVFAYAIGAATIEAADPPPAADQAALLAGARELLGDPDPPHLAVAADLLQAPDDFEAGLDLVLAAIDVGQTVDETQ